MINTCLLYTSIHKIFEQNEIDRVVHFAAESHVDRSIKNPEVFVETNVLGTLVMLNSAKKAWELEDGSFKDDKKFLHVSTDEVYGSLKEDGTYFYETTPIDPHSPYSASKASSDMLVKAYIDTYKFPANITNCSNNYGPYQFPEKLIPLKMCIRDSALTIWASTALYEQGNLTIDGEDQSCNLMVQVLEGDNGFIVIAYVISLCFLTLVIYVVYYMVFIKKSKIEKIFLVILCAMGVMYMAIMTPYSVPDEGSHIRRMYIDTNKILGIEEAREGYYYMRYDDATIGLTREPCLYSYKTVWNHFFDMAENTELVEVEGRTVSAPFYLYLPGEIVFLFCRLLNIGPVMMFTLARIANFAFFVFMAYWGMKKLPFGKMVLFTIDVYKRQLLICRPLLK